MQESVPVSSLCLVIPAYRPGGALEAVLGQLNEGLFRRVIVVDDGSGPEFADIFTTLERRDGVTVLRHAVNLGKGAALKTGINHALAGEGDCAGVVTADADGQHEAADVRRVAEALAERPDHLVLGARSFDAETPLRSRAGNAMTRVLVRVMHGMRLRDTQTGLRGLPAELCRRVLRVEGSGYEFELETLLAAGRWKWAIQEVPIRTVYLDGNRSSHFNPLFDSLRIYYVLFRYSVASLATAVADNVAFYLAYSMEPSVGWAQVAGRCVALGVNYTLNKRMVFLAREAGAGAWVRYVGVVAVSGLLSYALLMLLRPLLGLPTMAAKIAAESLLFLFNFTVLRDFVFVERKPGEKATDWSAYYRSVPPTARLTRRYTTRTLLAALEENGFGSEGVSILEFGGANSCFLEAVAARFRPREYEVADTNQYGLDLLSGKRASGCAVRARKADVLGCDFERTYDLVFSVGLIEHFDEEGTARAVGTHLRHGRPGGHVLLSFPSPTGLYRVTRGLLETFGLWKFPDERPLRPAEVKASLQGRAEVVFEKTLWPLLLTQHMIVARIGEGDN